MENKLKIIIKDVSYKIIVLFTIQLLIISIASGPGYSSLLTKSLYAISTCDKTAIEKGSLFTDNSNCATKTTCSTSSTVPIVGGSQGIYQSGLQGPYIVEQFVTHVLKAIAIKTNKPESSVVTQEHIIALIAFAGAEGGGVDGNQGTYNLFNTKRNDPDLGGVPYVTDNGRDDETMNYPSFDSGIEATARTMVSNKYQSRLIIALTDPNVTADGFMEILTYYDRYEGNKAWAAASDPKSGGNPIKYLETQLSLVKSVRENYAARAGKVLDGWTGGGEVPKPTGSGGVAGAGGGYSGGCATTDDNQARDTNNIPCVAGTEDQGEATGYSEGKPYKIRLCSIPGLMSVDGTVVAKVNSTASQNFLDLFNAAKQAGHILTFNGAYSSFRSNEQQEQLCNENRESCDKGFTAKPGFSNHQMGFAIDFNFDGFSTGSNNLDGRCKKAKSDNKKCELPESPTWVWMRDNAEKYGIKQLWFEYWHWGTKEEEK